jgi:predicted transposase/invertase (TIGR01784 family)
MERLEKKESITEYFEVFLRYVLNAREDIRYEDIVEKITNVSKERSGELMTIAEKLIEKGREEGIEKGIEKGKIETAIEMLILGSDIEFASKATKISIDVIKLEYDKHLKNEGNKNK